MEYIRKVPIMYPFLLAIVVVMRLERAINGKVNSIHRNLYYVLFTGKVVDVGINCPLGTVLLRGEKSCRCTETGICTITRKVGNKIQVIEF